MGGRVFTEHRGGVAVNSKQACSTDRVGAYERDSAEHAEPIQQFRVNMGIESEGDRGDSDDA